MKKVMTKNEALKQAKELLDDDSKYDKTHGITDLTDLELDKEAIDDISYSSPKSKWIYDNKNSDDKLVNGQLYFRGYKQVSE